MKQINQCKWGWLCCLAILCGVLGLGPPGAAQSQTLPGDINGDGAIDILDVQASVNMALGATAPQAQADIDLNEAVDVLDVQNLTNTVLGVGGLVQRISGAVSYSGEPVKAVAISQDGRMVEAEVDASGAFELALPVRTAWSLGFLAGPQGSEVAAGSVLFPVATGASVSLPLPNLSRGNVLELGEITLAPAAEIEPGVCTLLSETADPITFEDRNGNGAPDIVEDWLLPLDLGPASVLGLSVDDEDVIGLLAVLTDCAESQGLEPYAPDLSSYRNGKPLAIQPLLLCIPPVVEQWIRDHVNIRVWMEPLLDTVVDTLTKEIEEQIEDWFRATDIPELTDNNRNRVPDFIEQDLCVLSGVDGVEPGCELDADGDGRPDFLQDADNNGRPNIVDPGRLPNDNDGDGISDANDVDDNNDGRPDYADAASGVKE